MSILDNTSVLQQLLEQVNTLPTVGGEQAAPVISVNSSGLIIATAGSKSSAHQLAFQAAKTITPSSVSQTAVSSGYYTGGNVTVAGDNNLVASNIKNGVSIFGVSGNYVGSGGDTSVEDGLVKRDIISYTNDNINEIGAFAFCSCAQLTAISCVNVSRIDNNAFGGCEQLTTLSFPNVYKLGTNVFANCYALSEVHFPNVESLDLNAFSNCKKLQTASFSKIIFIRNSAFERCLNLKSLYLTGSSLCTLSNSNAFTSTPIGGYSISAGTYGSIYVPASLLTAYQKATNWTYFSSRFVGI